MSQSISDAVEAYLHPLTVEELIIDSHERSCRKGWYDGITLGGPNIPEKLALIHSEISEALEAYRNGEMVTHVTPEGKPDGFPIELADAMIRIADLAGLLKIDLASAIRQKAAFNETRPYRHGGKRA